MRKLWTFDRDSDGFRFIDDAFSGTSAPRAAVGVWNAPSGALAVRLGGDDANGASGGWQTSFTLARDQNITLSFRVRISQDGRPEGDDITQVLAAIDGALRGVGSHDFALRVRGGAEAEWKTVTVSLGALEAGRHTLTLGAHSRGEATTGDLTTVQIDDVRLTDKPRLAAFEAEVLRLTNAFRREHDLDPLKNDMRLNDAAEDWSRKMARRDVFEHSDGPSQVEKQGYDWSHWGENIAAGYTTPRAVVQGWINSPGHRANLLSDEFTEIGIGYHRMANDGGNAPYTHYWTQEFGTPHDTLI